MNVLQLLASIGIVASLNLGLVRPVQAHDASDLTVESLTVNSRNHPLGIDAEDISLAWSLRSKVRGAGQQAYQLRVGTRLGGANVWVSGKVDSDQQVDIRLPSQIRLASATRYLWQVRVWDRQGRASHWSTPAWFETGLIHSSDWKRAEWIGAAVDHVDQPRPLLRREFRLRLPVRQARLYATAEGVYQIWMNGQPVGDQFLAPGWTDYRQRLQVQTYDVTHQLRRGSNAIGVALVECKP